MSVKNWVTALRRICAGRGKLSQYLLIMIVSGPVGVIWAWSALVLAWRLDVSKSIGTMFFIPALLCAVIMILSCINAIYLIKQQSQLRDS